MTKIHLKEDLQTLPAAKPAKRRGEKQERSLQRRAIIADAAIEVVATHGIAGVTHRLVAQVAQVSLAATTYYFDTKFDIVAEASRRTLQGYSDAFHLSAARFKAGPDDPTLFRDFAIRLIHNAAERDRTRALCWAEITLDAHRHVESLQLTRQWFAQLADVWLEIASATGLPKPEEISQSAIDIVIGLLLVTMSIGLTPAQIDAVFSDGVNPLDVWAVEGGAEPEKTVLRRTSRKSAETREKIIRAAIEALLSDGPDSIAYRAIAARAGITPAGPFYHFPTIDGLLAAAQLRLFEDSKQRYRAVATEISGVPNSERLIDRTATVLVREATQFADENLASYGIWLQAARKPDLRPMIWSAIADQYVAWQRLLTPLMPQPRALDPLLAFALFVGKQVRILSTGSSMKDLALVRSEFARDFTSLLKSSFWL